MTLKRIDDPANFLTGTGLLFEINRRVLHPFGLALEIIQDVESGESKIGGVWDKRDVEGGMLFLEGSVAEGAKKFKAFLEEFGYDKLKEREADVGFQVQPVPGSDEVLR